MQHQSNLQKKEQQFFNLLFNLLATQPPRRAIGQKTNVHCKKMFHKSPSPQ